MKLLLFIHLLFFGDPSRNADPDTLVSCHFSNKPFTEFCDYIYRGSGVRIYYHESWIRGLKVTLDADSISVVSAVKMAVKGTGLEVSAWNHNLVVLKGEALPEGLPRFEMQQVKPDSATPGTSALTRSEERYLTGRKADVTQTLRVGKKGVSIKNSGGDHPWPDHRAANRRGADRRYDVPQGDQCGHGHRPERFFKLGAQTRQLYRCFCLHGDGDQEMFPRSPFRRGIQP